MRALGILIVIGMLGSVAGAQPALAIGQPLPSPDLAVGTVTVRVIDGSSASPHPNVVVTMTVGTKTRTATTDTAGRTTFEGVAVGASVQVRVKSSKDPLATSTKFVIPDDGGIRVMLSLVPMTAARVGSPRATSGVVMPDETLAAGSLEVRLAFDDDPKPPAVTTVMLAGYNADDRVTVRSAKTDAAGIARFANLDHSGAVAYYALAQLARSGADRLMSHPILLDAHGARVDLAGELRTAKSPPVDELVTMSEQKAEKTAKGKVRVTLEGAVDPHTQVAVIDATTGNAIATATVPDKALVIDMAAKSDRVLYVEATSHGRHYRSPPFQPVADRGAQVALYIYPRVMATYQFQVHAFDDLVQVSGRVRLQNNSWSPYAEAGEIFVPLPKGARALQLEAGPSRDNRIDLGRTIPPGGRDVSVTFELPATAGKVEWSLDLPYGAFRSEMFVESEPGVELVPPRSKTVTTTTTPKHTWLSITDITIVPPQAMVMTIKVPKPPKDAAVQHACRALDPDRSNPLLGKVLPDAELAQLDGRKKKLSALRGTATVINMMASWDSLSAKEHPQLARLAKEVAGISVVLVASDRTASDAIAMVGAKPAFHVVLDPPSSIPDDNIGVVTRSWGTTLLPESLLLDRAGVVRFYFPNTRDWDSPEARACVKALVSAS